MGGLGLKADTFKAILFAIVNTFPHVRDVVADSRTDEGEVQHCVLSMSELLNNEKSFNDFCRRTEVHVLQAACASCITMWVQLRLHELGT